MKALQFLTTPTTGTPTRAGRSALQQAADHSPRSLQLQALQRMADSSARVGQLQAMQRMEEEDLQGKFIQRMEDDELQGKFIQRMAEDQTQHPPSSGLRPRPATRPAFPTR